jgi:hypothetical protein
MKNKIISFRKGARKRSAKRIFLISLIVPLAVVMAVAWKTTALSETQYIHIEASGFKLSANSTVYDGDKHIGLVIDSAASVPFSQYAVKQSTEATLHGPDLRRPYFTVRFAMPVPPCPTIDVAALTGLHPMVFRRNHSPGFVILPNGDALAIYFSTPAGKSEADTSTSFVQARLRYGSVEWDMPDLFFKTKGFNDQSGLLWNDNGKVWFFGGGRDISDYIPFRIAKTTDNGATWMLSLPQLDKPATNYTAQPITSVFRRPDNSISFAMDGDGASSFLWHSADNGIHWQDMGGRTGGRHSVIVPLDDQGNLLSIGGKNSNAEGWSPENYSSDWGATWSESKPSAFPPLGSGQRPSMIRLASGNLLFVSDSYLHSKEQPPPPGWKHGDNCFVAISKDNGTTWHIKPLPVQLPPHHTIGHPALGYATLSQAPNGVIHLLTTKTLPSLHYEFNEAWVWSDAGDITPENSGGKIKDYAEYYPSGTLRSKWSARICPEGRYLLNGDQVDYYEDGTKEHVVTYKNGRKTGEETFWLPNGTRHWTWQRDLKNNRAIWTHYWPNGNKKIESEWNTKPEARDLNRLFFGYVAHGPSRHWDEQGNLVAKHIFVNGDLEEK